MMLFAVICSVLTVVIMGAFIFLQWNRNEKISHQMELLTKDIEIRIESLQKNLQDQNTSQWQSLQSSYQNYNDSLGKMHHQLGTLQQASQQVIELGKSVSSIQDLFQSPKLRGNFGEFLLEELLKQVFPQDHYETQYRFANGVQVDAILKFEEGIVAIDSKFPLENYERSKLEDEAARRSALKAFSRDVKKHIDDISSKYIQPAASTFDFAMMYIPSESVYYEIICSEEDSVKSLSDYAMKKRVVVVSPNSLYLYLQSMMKGLQGLKMQESVRAIMDQLNQLHVLFEQLHGEYQKIGSHLANSVSAYDRTLQRMTKIQNQIEILQMKKENQEASGGVH